MKKDCKPCITISVFWKLAKIHFREFLKDVKSFNQVNRLSCEIHFDSVAMRQYEQQTIFKEVADVRKLAAENFSEDSVEK